MVSLVYSPSRVCPLCCELCVLRARSPSWLIDKSYASSANPLRTSWAIRNIYYGETCIALLRSSALVLNLSSARPSLLWTSERFSSASAAWRSSSASYKAPTARLFYTNVVLRKLYSVLYSTSMWRCAIASEEWPSTSHSCYLLLLSLLLFIAWSRAFVTNSFSVMFLCLSVTLDFYLVVVR